MKGVGILYGHLVCFSAIWFSLWPLRTFMYGYLVFFYHFGMLYQEKSGNPG
jgi:hypothetical protein